MANLAGVLPGASAASARRAIDGALELSVIGSFTRLGPAVRRHLWDWSGNPGHDLTGATVVVTGANSGLGFATAEALAQRGAAVVMVTRSRERGERAAAELAERVGDDSFAVFEADLGDLKAVARVGHEIAEQHGELRALIHNAGALSIDRKVSPQGHELSFASMVLGPQLLTHCLLDALDADEGRCIWVTSGGMYTQRLHLDDLEMTQGYRGSVAYARAKRAQVDLVAEWATRHDGATSFHATHPGWAATPGVADSLPTFDRILGPALRSPAEGCDTTTWLVGAPEGRMTTGLLWFDRRPRSVARLPNTASSPDTRARLWDIVENMIDPTE